MPGELLYRLVKCTETIIHCSAIVRMVVVFIRLGTVIIRKQLVSIRSDRYCITWDRRFGHGVFRTHSAFDCQRLRPKNVDLGPGNLRLRFRYSVRMGGSWILNSVRMGGSWILNSVRMALDHPFINLETIAGLCRAESSREAYTGRCSIGRPITATIMP